jgi:hypothetical protein
MKIIIGLYKNKETGEFDTMINQIDNKVTVHNGLYELVKEFEHIEKNKEEILRNEILNIKYDIGLLIKNYFEPVFVKDRTMDLITDDKINNLRDNLYIIMCRRRRLDKLMELK